MVGIHVDGKLFMLEDLRIQICYLECRDLPPTLSTNAHPDKSARAVWTSMDITGSLMQGIVCDISKYYNKLIQFRLFCASPFLPSFSFTILDQGIHYSCCIFQPQAVLDGTDRFGDRSCFRCPRKLLTLGNRQKEKNPVPYLSETTGAYVDHWPNQGAGTITGTYKSVRLLFLEGNQVHKPA